MGRHVVMTDAAWGMLGRREIRKGRAVAEGFFPIPMSSLRLDTVADFALYLEQEADQPPVLFRETSLHFNAESLQRLKDNNIQELLVDERQEKAYRRYVEQNLNLILADETAPMGQKTDILYGSARNLMAEVMADPRAGDVVPRSKAFVESTCEFLRRERSAFALLLKITSFDYYTYTHSVNVFVFSVALAQRHLDQDPETLKKFGTGVLLHDIGKSMISPEILNCRGKLSDEQWIIMKQHPRFGRDILLQQGVADPITLDVVFHHHEKVRGRGYPEGLSGKEISPFVRVCTIADIFDALTTRRSYKDAVGSFPALSLMRDEMEEDLDKNLFRAFVQMMGAPE